MSSMNLVLLLGNVTRDPELKSTAGGLSILEFSLATNTRKKQGDSWVDVPEYHSIVTFGKQAEQCAAALKKGSKAQVRGRIETQKWTDKDNVKRYTTKIIAEDFGVIFLTPKSQGDGEYRQGRGQAEPEPEQAPDGDIPF